MTYDLDVLELDDLELLPYLAPAEAVADRHAAVGHALARVAWHYDGDELATSWREAERDLARLELVNGRRAWTVEPSAEAVTARKLAALHYRQRARAVVRLVSSSAVWDDPELLAVVLNGRRAIRAALAGETDELRTLVLELALSILDELLSVLVETPPALVTENAPGTAERAHRRHRRRRAGPCLHRPRPSHARRADDPHESHGESSHPYGATLSRLSSNPGGSR